MSLLYKHRGDTEQILILLQSLKEAGHKILFVFDGKAPAEKEQEVRTRIRQKSEASGKLEALKTFLESSDSSGIDASARNFLETSVERLQDQSWHMTRELRRAFQGELWKAGIPYVKSISEADDVLIDLDFADKIDVIITSDMDFIVSGVKTVWVPIQKEIFQFEEISLQRILSGERLTASALMDAGLLCGTDAPGIPCAKAMTLLRHYGSLERILKSSIKNPVVHTMFPDEASIAVARESVLPKEAYSRIRLDHLERVKDFLASL